MTFYIGLSYFLKTCFFSEICPICSCCLSQRSKHSTDATGILSKFNWWHIKALHDKGTYHLVIASTGIIPSIDSFAFSSWSVENIWLQYWPPDRLSCWREWPSQMQKPERSPAGDQQLLKIGNSLTKTTTKKNGELAKTATKRVKFIPEGKLQMGFKPMRWAVCSLSPIFFRIMSFAQFFPIMSIFRSRVCAVSGITQVLCEITKKSTQ